MEHDTTPADAALPAGASLLVALNNRDFRLLFIGQLLSQIGDQFLIIAALSLIKRLTESPLALSIMVLAIAVPQVIFGLIGGVLVDRFNRKQVLIVADVARALVILPVMLVEQRGDLWILYLCASALTTAGTAFYPARNAVIPNIVSSELLLSANTLLQASYILALILGATSAGFVIQWLGVDAAVVFDSATFLISVLLIALMLIPSGRAAGTHESARTLWGQLVQGLRYVASSRLLLRVLAITAVAALGIGSIQILGLDFLSRRLNVAESGFGLTMAMLGVGVALGGLVVQRIASSRPANQVVGVCLAGVGAAIIVFSLAPNFGFVLVAAAGIGLCIVVARAGLATLTQQLVPDQVRGRVESAVNMMVSISTTAAQVLAGLLGDPHFLGSQGVFIGAGVVTLGAGLGAIYALRGAVQTAMPKLS